ncbi:MAG: CPBP family intramembrane metalloprotease [Polyangiaceae bacterium]|nr:CPBP family intramembrane metalloprotease [Polyangiaceae bacterium]
MTNSDTASSTPAWMAWASAVGLTVAMALVFLVTLSRDAQSTRPVFLGLGALYLVTSVLAVLRYRKRDELHLVKPRGGDLTFGGLVAFLLFGLVFVVHSLVTAPGTPQHGWIIRIYLMMGDPFADNRHLVAAGAALVGLMEELSWRGFVTPMLEERIGVAKGNVVSVLLYTAGHVTTVMALGDPIAGPNPLLPLAALGCGAAWSYLRWRMERMPPVLLSHALFTWMVVEFPLWN